MTISSGGDVIMEEALESATRKMVRAAKHRTEFEALLASYLDSEPIDLRFATRKDPDGFHWYIDYYADAKEQPPAELGLVAGDIVGNYRAALDHLVWGLSVKHAGGTPSRAERIQFPIQNKRTGTAFSPQGLHSVSPEVRSAIERHQPYNFPGDDKSGHPLWILRRLSNVDKHQVVHLHACFGERTGAFVQSKDGTSIEPVTWIEIEDDGLIDGDRPFASARLHRMFAPGSVEVHALLDAAVVVLDPLISRPVKIPRIFDRIERGVYEVLGDLSTHFR